MASKRILLDGLPDGIEWCRNVGSCTAQCRDKSGPRSGKLLSGSRVGTAINACEMDFVSSHHQTQTT